MKKVSVILTTCNSENTLQQTIGSIMNQSGINKLFEHELLVIDYCSSGNSVEILSRNSINFFSTPENISGPTKGRNIGLKMLTGDYYCIMVHDDLLYPEKIIKQLPVAERFPVVSTGYRVVNKRENRILGRNWR